MLVYDLKFSDGRGCRYIAANPEDSEALELRALQGIFGQRLISMQRIIAPAPTKLPWKSLGGGRWHIDLFALSREADGSFRCIWPGGDVTGGKAEIEAAVRGSWHLREGWKKGD